MVTVVFISADGRFVTQANAWLSHMPNPVRVESFSSFDSFFTDKPKVEVESKDGVDIAENEGIRVVVLDVDLLGQKPIQSITEFLEKFKEKRTSAWNLPPKIFVMSYAEGFPRPAMFQHAVVDDLILKPIDRSVFLQKLEILLAKDKVTPSFLYRQKTDMPIEVGKEIMIDELSEFAISMRNPGPLKEGLFAAIHSSVLGEGLDGRIIGRVFESAPHPVREGESIVRFSFFGTTPEQLANIRKYLRTQQTGAKLKSPGRAQAAARAEAQTVLGKTRRFAVIDMNPGILNDVKSTIEQGVRYANVKPFPSYSRFMAELARLVDADQPESAAKVDPTSESATSADGAAPADDAAVPKQALPGGARLTVFLQREGRTLLRFEPPLGKTDLVFGLSGADWLKKPDQFLNLVEKSDVESFQEFMAVVESDSVGRCVCRMHDSEGALHYIEVIGDLDKSAESGPIVRLAMQEVDAGKWRDYSAASVGSLSISRKDLNGYRFEALFVDASIIRPDPVSWYESLTTMMRSAKVLHPDEKPPKIFLMGNSKAQAKPENFRSPGFADFLYKPLDRRQLLVGFQALVPGLIFKQEPDFPPFVPVEIPAKLGKEIKMNELSEFGLSVMQTAPFREKIFMHFYSPLFGTNGWLVARSEYSTKDAEKKDAVKCQFSFFGPTDELLQRIRRFIREDYVAKKDTGS